MENTKKYIQIKESSLDDRYKDGWLSVCNVYITRADMESRFGLKFERLDENVGLGDAIVSVIKTLDGHLFIVGTGEFTQDIGVEFLCRKDEFTIDQAIEKIGSIFELPREKIEMFDAVVDV